MKHRSFAKSLLSCCAMIFGIAPGAYAFQLGGSGSSSVVEPSQELPPLPDQPMQVQPVRMSSIPPLPVSRACKQTDVEGLWRLLRVYEDPMGAEMASFSSNPVQYIYYKPDGTYGKYNGDGALAAADQIINHIDKHATGLQQYLLQDTGMIYYYQDKVATTSQACFITLKPRESFLPGEMLLIPPKGQISGRLIKEYTKVPMPPPAPPKQVMPTATPATTAGQNYNPATANTAGQPAVQAQDGVPQQTTQTPYVDPEADPDSGPNRRQRKIIQRQPIDPNDPVK